MAITQHTWRTALHLAALAAGFGVGCGVSTNTDANTSDPLAATYAATSLAAGTLVCTPGAAQVANCQGLDAGSPCTLVAGDGTHSWPGQCHATVDGKTVACVPAPPAPPAELVTPCNGHAAGDACQVTDPLGSARTGVCVKTKDGATLLCGRAMKPPEELTAACAGKAAGAACTATHGHMQFTGVCSLGPASTDTLACTPARDLVSPAEQACSGLDAGASCTMGRKPWGLAGSCVVPSSGDPALCVLPCDSVGGHFGWDGHKGVDGGLFPGDKHPLPMPGNHDPHGGGKCDRDGGMGPVVGHDDGGVSASGPPTSGGNCPHDPIRCAMACSTCHH